MTSPAKPSAKPTTKKPDAHVPDAFSWNADKSPTFEKSARASLQDSQLRRNLGGDSHLLQMQGMAGGAQPFWWGVRGGLTRLLGRRLRGRGQLEADRVEVQIAASRHMWVIHERTKGAKRGHQMPQR